VFDEFLQKLETSFTKRNCGREFMKVY